MFLSLQQIETFAPGRVNTWVYPEGIGILELAELAVESTISAALRYVVLKDKIELPKGGKKPKGNTIKSYVDFRRYDPSILGRTSELASEAITRFEEKECKKYLPRRSAQKKQASLAKSIPKWWREWQKNNPAKSL